MTGPSYAPDRPVALQPDAVRSAFIARVYGHLLVAFGLFMAIEVALFMGGAAEAIYNAVAGSSGAWLIVLGGFMVVNWMASRAAHNIASPQTQYLGLAAMAAAQALIFAPFLYLLFSTDGAGTVATAAVLTGLGFAGLTAVGMTTARDLSPIRPLLTWGGILALLLIVGALLFGFNLGTWFSVAMIGLAGGSILYQTQQIMRRYPEWAYVGAAVQLFASVMLMFWYVLRLLAARR